MQRKINWTQWFVYKWRKPCNAKTLPDNFKVTTPKNLLINNQAVTSIRNLTNYLGLSWNTNLGLNLCSNTQLDLSCSNLLFFDAQTSNLWLTLCTDHSMWLTPATWTDVVGCKVFHFINNEDQEALGYKILWVQMQ